MKLTHSCYAILGLGCYPPWMVNSGFIVGSKKTLIIDSGPTYYTAQTIMGYAKNVKPKNEIIVVNTEKHLDHIGGNSLFSVEGIKIYGHELINRNNDDLISDMDYFNKSILDEKRRAANEEKIFYEYTRIVNPGIYVRDGEKINLGGNKNVLIIFTPGHTKTNISILEQKEKVLYCGDCIVSGYLPNLESSTKEDWKDWTKSLELISNLGVEYIVPGHGKVLTGSEIPNEILRIKKILEATILNE
jgi:glyoxylase-like metal-dependent hydrolase (beta-lactamase superfamily II)